MIIPALVGIVLYILLFFVLWWFIRPDLGGAGGATQKRNFAQLMAQIAGGLALLFGLYFTWLRVEISQKTLETQQDQQVTERFTRAIDQLGATDDKGKKKLEIRLGGIYALERIARDSERDHWPIMETLTTYVREHAPWPPKKNTQETGFILPPQTEQRQKQALNKPDDGPESEIIPAPEPDIQAILTVLRRRTRHFGNGEVERLDLHQKDLRKGDLHGAHLEGASLREAHLEGAYLQGAHLEGAYLQGAHLEGAHLHGAHLEGAELLTKEQIWRAIGDETTKLPEGLKMPKSWANGASEQTDEDE